MGDRRRLLAEIERTIRKVSEGCATFEETWEKMRTAPNANQKEKYEEQLKKDIKKLQRLRDQIKTWVASSDIKDKKSLMDNRRFIEEKMEKFKEIERETKTKAFSKEGLQGPIVKDPAEQEKEDCQTWLSETIAAFEERVEKKEAEIERLSGQKKKKGKGGNDELESRQLQLEHLHHHIKKFEAVLRSVNNDVLVPSDVMDSLKETFDSWLESETWPPAVPLDSASADEQLNPHLPYDCLDIDFEDVGDLTVPASGPGSSPPKDDEALGSPNGQSSISPGPGAGPTQTNAHSAGSGKDDDHRASERTGGKKGKNSSEERAVSGRSSKSAVTTPIKPHPPAVTPSSSGTIPPLLSQPIVSPGLSGPVPPPVGAAVPPPTLAYSLAASAVLGSATSAAGQPSAASLQPAQQQQRPTGDLNAMARPFGETVPTAVESAQPAPTNAALAAPNTSTERSRPETPSATGGSIQNAHGSNLTASSVASVEQMVDGGSANVAAAAAVSSADVGAAGPTATGAAVSYSNAATPIRPTPPSSVPPLYSNNSGSTVEPSVSPSLTNGPSTLYAATASSETGGGLAAAISSMAPTSLTTSHSESAPVAASSTEGGANRPAISAGGVETNSSSTGPQQLQSLMSLAQQQLNTGGVSLQSLMLNAGGGVKELSARSGRVEIAPNLGIAPLGPVPLSDDQVAAKERIASSAQRIPQPADSERLRVALPRAPVNVPAYYPKEPLFNCDSFDFFLQLNNDTLFFVFYFMENTKAQYLAARALKSKSWRFHTKYLTWFQRHDDPKIIKEDHEVGTYIYWDFDKWQQSKKEDFKFEYVFLEDKDLS